jgi:hypothetical protein
MYVGDHWKIACELPKLGNNLGFDSTLWVCSAGYGLIPASKLIKPYAATFDTSHEDAVGKNPIRIQEWWRELCDKDSPREPSDPWAALSTTNPGDTVMAVMSMSYLRAVQTDISAKRQALANPNNFLLISTGCSNTTGPEQFHLPADSRLRQVVGGAMQSLNVRIARWLLEKATSHRQLNAPWAEKQLQSVLDATPDAPQYARQPQSDTQVKTFIHKHLKATPHLKQSPLLRIFRDEGLACEQKRFGQLYKQVLEN